MKKERQKRIKAGVIIGFVLIATVVFGSVSSKRTDKSRDRNSNNENKYG